MKAILDLLPIVFFGVAYFAFGKDFYFATSVFMVAMTMQVAMTYVWYKQVDKTLFYSWLIVLALGALTLVFRNEAFLKWKSTVIYWIFAGILWATVQAGKEPIIKKLMQKALRMPDEKWRWLNNAFIWFLVIGGFLNLAIAYGLSETIWVNFDLYGQPIIMLLFMFFIFYQLRHYIEEPEDPQSE